MVNIYSSNRDLEEEVEKGVEMLTVDIEKTPFYQIGEKRGIERGRVEEKLENAVIMIDKFKLSIDDITREFNLKKEELLEYMEQRDSQKSSS